MHVAFAHAEMDIVDELHKNGGDVRAENTVMPSAICAAVDVVHRLANGRLICGKEMSLRTSAFLMSHLVW